ncbi:MAG: pyrroloquinoline quinone-dependent dehydrogenase [Chitinophagaceae bacterium]|nr:pyrroloquinoline quinone-dependent dehydrogenase [Chitinophagaceae bacterium]
MKPTSFLIFLLLACSNLNAQKKQSTYSGWQHYGGDAGGMRYSDLQQVNDKNVTRLKPVWTYRTGELDTYRNTDLQEKAAFEATPVLADGVLFFSTPTCRVIAIDASTGKEKWVFDPGIDLKAGYSEVTSRGVSVWSPPGTAGDMAKRVFIATLDGRLIALNARNGAKIVSFGNNGIIHLREGFGNEWSITSPPAIAGNTIIVGSSMGDNQRVDYPRGTVRGYDVLSGALIWSWDPIPTNNSDPAWNTWKNNSAKSTGAANAWAVISADAERDMVFIPTSCPAPDYYGGERKGDNLYSNSVVALKASTGKMIWHYQVVHHDIWDYDIAAQPLLFWWQKNGKSIPAVAIGTKMGHIFVLNRETGKPLFPVEERAVPASDIPGEETAKTQPFPVLPEPLGLRHVSVNDAWGITAADKEEAAKRIARHRNEGIFTPPSQAGTLVTPGNVGGIHWGGMCYDAKKGLLITNINRLAAIITLIPREKAEQLEKEDPSLLRAETGRQKGTPYIMKRDYLFKRTEAGLLMQAAPPWGTLLAIDMKNAEKKWEVPLGYMLDPAQYPDAPGWGSINLGGAIVTAGNLVFVAATADNRFRAFNTETGKQLWETELPAGGQATPMTYAIHGKQYIVIAAGGHGKLGTKPGDYVVAYALD